MDAKHALEQVLQDLQEKQTQVLMQRAIILKTNPPDKTAFNQYNKALTKTHTQLEALDWAENIVRDHLNATRKLGKLDKRGHKNDG
jgi:hypothetical protein